MSIVGWRFSHVIQAFFFSCLIPKWDGKLWNGLSSQSLPFNLWWSGKSGIFLRAIGARWIPPLVFRMAQGTGFPQGIYDPCYSILRLSVRNWILCFSRCKINIHLRIQRLSCFFCFFLFCFLLSHPNFSFSVSISILIVNFWGLNLNSLAAQCKYMKSALTLFCISSWNDQVSSSRKS